MEGGKSETEAKEVGICLFACFSASLYFSFFGAVID